MAFNLTNLLSTLITANHILAYHSVLDAYGHISTRNPANASTFYLSRNLAPALVSRASDIVEYDVSTAQPVQGSDSAPSGYVERFIHSEIYRRHPGVASVIHSHAPDVLPYSVVEVPFQPLDQAGTAIGKCIPRTAGPAPVWDSAAPALVVSNARLGASLAAAFGPSNATARNATSPPPHALVLMHGHGMAVVGASVVDAVFRAVYAVVAARQEVTALALAGLGGRDGQPRVGGDAGGGVRYLSAEERVAASVAGLLGNEGRAWELWVREVEAAAKGAVFRNEVGSPI
ncbi:class II aldolase and Adducin N-terminal domain-containing protein [Macrophomina phaseolina]|uniref:Class II aldolase and Adducin N-terminal domain-containing protein n=1 Tax=Macrophomina phaseolina TaxID=35725 RepID=A0ABQ8FW50_9PEZI|nr:class II aldolase and Adducin N-terminal domain-containing protein [Macrophomina phaseolina]